MKTLARALALLATAAALPACQTEDPLYSTGVSKRAGNAIAANTVMQMVDPWQAGVDDTDLVVPADRGGTGEDGGGATAAAPPVQVQPTQ